MSKIQNIMSKIINKIVQQVKFEFNLNLESNANRISTRNLMDFSAVFNQKCHFNQKHDILAVFRLFLTSKSLICSYIYIYRFGEVPQEKDLILLCIQLRFYSFKKSNSREKFCRCILWQIKIVSHNISMRI